MSSSTEFPTDYDALSAAVSMIEGTFRSTPNSVKTAEKEVEDAIRTLSKFSVSLTKLRDDIEDAKTRLFLKACVTGSTSNA